MGVLTKAEPVSDFHLLPSFEYYHLTMGLDSLRNYRGLQLEINEMKTSNRDGGRSENLGGGGE